MCSGSRFSARYCDPQTTEKNTAKKGGRLKLGSLKLNTQGKKNPKKKIQKKKKWKYPWSSNLFSPVAFICQ